VNPLRRLGLWLAGESVKSITTAQTLPKWQRGRPYRPPSHTITNREALRGMRAAGVVYACIRLIADAATSVPLNVYQRAGSDWEHAESHPLQLLLNSPNAKLTRRRLYYRAVQHLLLSGNAILTKVRVPKTGLPVQLFDADNGLEKFNPLADWTEKEVWAYIRLHDVPYNALHDRFYPSIGCAPCTRPVAVGEDVRAGRWWWENPESKECGLHVLRKA